MTKIKIGDRVYVAERATLEKDGYEWGGYVGIVHEIKEYRTASGDWFSGYSVENEVMPDYRGLVFRFFVRGEDVTLIEPEAA